MMILMLVVVMPVGPTLVVVAMIVTKKVCVGFSVNSD